MDFVASTSMYGVAFAKKTIATMEATLKPEIVQEYCMTWSNHQPQAVQLKYQFQINVK